MNKQQYVIIGAGGHAKVVLDLLRKKGKTVVGLTDATLDIGQKCLDAEVLGNDDILQGLYQKGVCWAAMGIGHVGMPAIRNKVYHKTKELGYIFPILVHPSAVVSESAEIGEGTMIGAQSVVNPETRIGELCIINTAAVVEHEAVIENGVHIAPHATVLGAANIGENTFVGAGSVILQGIKIGANCIIGAGSVVLHDVPDNCVVVGVPGNIIKRR